MRAPSRLNFLYFHVVFGKIWPNNRLIPPCGWRPPCGKSCSVPEVLAVARIDEPDGVWHSICLGMVALWCSICSFSSSNMFRSPKIHSTPSTETGHLVWSLHLFREHKKAFQ